MPWHNSMDKFISAQFKQWQQKEKIDVEEVKKPHPFITISREYGSGGYEIAHEIASAINTGGTSDPVWAAYDRKLLEKVMDDTGLSESLTETMTSNARKSMTNFIQTSFSKFPSQVTVFRRLVETIRLLAINGHVIVVGRAGNVITRDIPGGMHIRIIAPMEYKIERMVHLTGQKRPDVEKLIKTKTKERDGFIKEYVKFEPADPDNYDLIINNDRYTSKEAAQLIISAIKLKGLT